MKDKKLKAHKKFLVKRTFVNIAIIIALCAVVILLGDMIYTIVVYLIIGGFGLLLLFMIYITMRKFFFKKIELRKDSIFVKKINFPLKRIYSVYVEGHTIYICMSASEDENVVRGMVKDPKFFNNVFSAEIKNSQKFFSFLESKGFSESIEKFHRDLYSEIGDADKELTRLKNNSFFFK